MQQLETDLNYISSLPDRPAMATQELKREFDKAGNTIKNYINSIMIPDLVTYQTELQASVANQITSVRTELEGAMNTLQTTLEGEMSTLQTTIEGQISTLQSTITQTLNAKIITQTFSGTFNNMGDAEYTANLTPTIPSGYKYLTANWDSFGDTDGDEPKQPVYMPHTNKIRVHIGSAQVGHIRNHTYRIVAYYIKVS